MSSEIKILHKNEMIGVCTVSYSDAACVHFDIDAADKYPSDAEVTLSVWADSLTGTQVVDEAPCNYKAGSEGVYTCAVEPDPEIEAGRVYFWNFKIVSAFGVTSNLTGQMRAAFNS